MKRTLQKLFLIILWPISLYAPIYETKKIADITQHISGKNVLVVFDIDNTLIEPDNEIASPQWFDWHLEKLKKQGMKTIEAIEIILPQHLAANKKTKVNVVETNTDDLIHALQKKSVYPLALTARGFIDPTLKQLKTAQIDLSKQKKWRDRCFIFDSFPRKAYYTPGILFANGNDKGEVLEAFLKKLKYRPRKIVFVDDILKNVESVEKMTKRMGMKNYIGIHYTHLDEKVRKFNKKMARSKKNVSEFSSQQCNCPKKR